MDERLARLEMLFSEQGKTLEDLSAELYQQQLEVKRLTARVSLLEEKLTSIEEPNDIGGHDRPPHY